ncbi:MAG TPA: hypothetical protein VFV98_10800, partial [Vicinamibacterales bacterium]|nr:hypothetical protein [Vicinamibacterales bacterium]
ELIYAQRGNEVFVNLFINSEAKLKIGDANVTITQTSNYPWDGRVRIRASADRATKLQLRVRVPIWTTGQTPIGTDLYTFPPAVGAEPVLSIFDAVRPSPRPGWADLPMTLQPGTGGKTNFMEVRLNLPMPVRRVLPNDGIRENAGKAAIQRGPLVYALEGADNDGKVLDIVAPLATQFTPVERKDLLGGVTTLTATLAASGEAPARTITAIPYFAWANRGRGEMVVWIRR